MDNDYELSSGTDYDSLSTDSDSEVGYAQIFQRLVGSFMAVNSVNSSFQRRPKTTKPVKFKYKLNLDNLNKSEYSFVTKQTSGLLDKRKSGSNITSMIINRERGLCASNSFSTANKCRIANWFLPNQMKQFCNYDGKVFCGIFSTNGKYFVTASQDQYIRVYNAQDAYYKHLKTIKAIDVGWSIIDVAFSPDQEHFAYSTWSTALQICPVDGDVDKQETLNLIQAGRRFCVFSLVFSSDGTELLGGANDGCIYVYDRKRNETVCKIEAHGYDVNNVSFADCSSQIIYSGGDDGLIKVWDRRTLNEANPLPVGTLAGHMDGITYICSRGDGKHLISNSKDQSIKLWDVRQFSSDLATNNTIKAVQEQSWDYRWQGVPKKMYNKDQLEGDSSVMTYRGHVVTRTLIRCRFSPVETTGQRFIYTGCGNGSIIIYDALTGNIHKENKGHSACVRDVFWHPYRNEILSSSWDCSVGFWQYKRKEKEPKKIGAIRRSERLASKK